MVSIFQFSLIAKALAQVFTGQVYLMTEHATSDECQAQLECDCCSSDIVFLTDKVFVMADRCIHNNTYFRGTYTAIDEYLTLKFSQFSVEEIYNDTTEESRYEKNNLKIPSARFYITTCNTNKSILQATDLKVLTKAFKEPAEKAERKIKALKESRAWALLQ
jgi:hypothetical protein